jgi:hypothetical protein
LNLNKQRQEAILAGYTAYKSNVENMRSLIDDYELAEFDIQNARTGDTERTQRQRKQIELQQKANKIMREGTSDMEDFILKGKDFNLAKLIEKGDTEGVKEYQNVLQSMMSMIAESKKLEAELAKDRIAKRTDLTKTQAQHNSRMEGMEQQHMDQMANIRIDGDAKIQDIIQGKSADQQAIIKARNESEIEDAEKTEREKYNIQVQQERSQHAQAMRNQKNKGRTSLGVDTDWYSNLMGSDLWKDAEDLFTDIKKGTGFEGSISSRGGIEEMLMGGGLMDAQGGIDFTKIQESLSMDLQEKYKEILSRAKRTQLPPLVENTKAIKENTSMLKKLIDWLASKAEGFGDVADSTGNVSDQIAKNGTLQSEIPSEPPPPSEVYGPPTANKTTVNVSGHELTQVVTTQSKDGIVPKNLAGAWEDVKGFGKTVWEGKGQEGANWERGGERVGERTVRGMNDFSINNQARDKAKPLKVQRAGMDGFFFGIGKKRK